MGHRRALQNRLKSELRFPAGGPDEQWREREACVATVERALEISFGKNTILNPPWMAKSHVIVSL